MKELITIDPKNISKKLGFFRFSPVNGSYLLTNDVGDFVFITPAHFEQFISGQLDKESDIFKELKDKHFIREEADKEILETRYRRKNEFLNFGPHLHIVITTLRCNERCIYCHASRRNMDETSYDMGLHTAKKVVDTIFQTTSPNIIIEFQGGEPLANMEAIRFITEYATEKSKEEDKRLGITLVTNLSLMTEETMKYLLDHNVMICTSLDGPEHLHNKNRVLSGGSSYGEAVKWIKRINEEYVKRGLEPELYHVDALLTTSQYSLPYAKEIVDEYLNLGIRALHVRPLNPFGTAKKAWDIIGYTPEEYIDFYKQVLDYVIELNLQGTDMLERTAAIFLSKILTEDDPDFLDLRSPCGAGIGQLAYNYDGKVFTCDEGRMVFQMDDDIFLLGDVGTNTYTDLIHHEALRSLTIASCLDCLPGCTDCVFKPYCGVCPIYNYMEQGDIFGQIPNNGRCKIHKAILTYLFTRMRENPELKEIFTRWTINKRPLLYIDT